MQHVPKQKKQGKPFGLTLLEFFILNSYY